MKYQVTTQEAGSVRAWTGEADSDRHAAWLADRAAAPPLALEVEDDAALRHRQHREALAAEKRRQREEIEERRTRPLVGSRGDFEQSRLFGKEELFQ